MPGLPPLAYLALLLLIVLLLVFALGTRRNIQKGNALLQWLQGGLPVLGRRTSFRWLGSSAVVLTISRASDPFKEAEVVAVMEPRDVPLWWLWSRRRGRRDFLILRGTLRKPPRFELQAADPVGWAGPRHTRRDEPEGWERADWGSDSPRVTHSGHGDVQAIRRSWTDLGEASGGVWRLSVRRDPPHLEVHVVPPEPGASAEGLFHVFAELGRRVTGAS